MKKWKLIILTFLMIITLSGCGKEETKDNSKTPTVVEPGPSIPQTPNNPPVEPTPSIPVVPTPVTLPAFTPVDTVEKSTLNVLAFGLTLALELIVSTLVNAA